jgi:hypothetical protein
MVNLARHIQQNSSSSSCDPTSNFSSSSSKDLLQNFDAILDDEHVDIAEVLNYKFIPPTSKKRTDIQFLMTWDNDPDPKWYRWNSSLRNYELVHEYLDTAN